MLWNPTDDMVRGGETISIDGEKKKWKTIINHINTLNLNKDIDVYKA